MGVRRILGVANRSPGNGQSHAEELADVLDAEVLTIPEDASVEKADNLAMAAMDHDPSSPAMAAVARLADRLLAVGGDAG